MAGAGVPDNRRDMRFGAQVNENERRVFEWMKKLGAIRKAHPALRHGSRRTLIADANSYAFLRAQLNDRLAFVVNRGEAPVHLKLNVAPEMRDGGYTDALSGTKVKVANGELAVEVPPRAAMFITR